MITVPRRDRPSLSELSRGLRALAEKARTGRARPNDLDARDPDFVEQVLPMMGGLYDDYFRCETEVEAPLPEGAFLAVGNHNAMTGTPDMFCHMVAFWRLTSPRRVAYGLMHDVPFKFPVGGTWLNAAGAIAASPDNARRALERDAAVLVFPGGDLDACKPYSRRYEIELAGRKGFLRTAIRAGVPIVPIVSAGGHSSLYIFSDGKRVAQALGLPRRVRSNVLPVGVAMPWGLVVGFPYPHLPPPVKIHTRIGKPIHLNAPKSAADDPQTLDSAYGLVHSTMQTMLDDLKRAGRHGFFPKAKP